MKKLTTPEGVFGPYQTVNTLPDRYECDGAHLPFSVVGQGTIDEWAGPLPVPAPIVVVPQVVPMRQFRAALVEMDLDEQVDAFLASVPGKDGRRARADYDSATEVRRDWPLLVSMVAAMGKTPAELDAVMTLAATL